MAPIVIVIIIAVTILAVLFTLAARSWHFAQAIQGIFKWCAWPFEFVTTATEVGRKAIRASITRTLPPLPVGKIEEDEEKQPRSLEVTGLRINYIIFCICIVGGDLPSTQLRNSFLQGLETYTHIPLPLDILQAIVWLFVSAMLIEWLVDLTGKTPRGANIFPYIKNTLWRWLLIMVAALLTVTSLIDFALLFYYGQYPVSIGELSLDVKTLGLHIVLAFGLTSGVAGAIAIAAAVRRGWLGLATVFLGLLYCAATIFQLPFALIGKWIVDFGEMIAKMQPIQMNYQQVTVVPEPYLLPPAASQAIEGATPNTKEMPKIMNTNRNVVCVGLGLSNQELLALTLNTLIQMHGEEYLLAYGGVDPYMATHKVKPLPIFRGALNITPSNEEISIVTAGSSSTDEAFENLAQFMVSKITDAYANTISVSGTIIVFADMRIATFMQAPLQRLKNSLPMAKVILKTSLPMPLERDGRVPMAMGVFKSLQQRGAVDAIVVTDPTSPLAQKRGKDVQTAYDAQAIAGMIVSPHHHDGNPSLPELVDLMRALSPVGFAFDTEHIATGKEPLRWKLVRLVNRKLGPKGEGNLLDAIQKMKQAIVSATNNADNLGTNVPINPQSHFIALLIAPFRQRGRKRSDFFTENVLRDLGKSYHNAVGIIVRANGVPNFKLGSGYFCTAACIYPLLEAMLMPGDQQVRQLPTHEDTSNL